MKASSRRICFFLFALFFPVFFVKDEQNEMSVSNGRGQANVSDDVRLIANFEKSCLKISLNKVNCARNCALMESVFGHLRAC